MMTSRPRKQYSRRAHIRAGKRKAEKGNDTSESGESEKEEGNIATPFKRARQIPSSPRTQPHRSTALSAHSPDDALEKEDVTPGDSLEMDEVSTKRLAYSVSNPVPLSPQPIPGPKQSPVLSLHASQSRQDDKGQDPGPSTPRRQTLSTRSRTPQSSPRDLSDIFSKDSSVGDSSRHFNRSLSSADQRSGGLRRMLTKAQSLGEGLGSPSPQVSRESTPTRLPQTAQSPSTPGQNLDRSHSLPASPFESPHGSTQSTSAFQPDAERSKRTYGKSRTFIEDNKDDRAIRDDVHRHEVEDVVVAESYAELRRRYEVDDWTQPEKYSSGNLMNDLLQARAPQPVSDMRSKGENRRFQDELAYLVDGIMDPATSVNLKRTSSLEILRNMLDEDWMARFYVCGESEKVWHALQTAGDQGDEIMDVICLLYLASLIDSATGLESILATNAHKCASIVLEYLPRKETILDYDLSAAPLLRRKLNSALSNIAIAWSTPSPTLRRLASYLAVQLSQGSYWDQMRSELACGSALSMVTRSIISESHSACDRVDSHASRLEPAAMTRTFDYEHYCLMTHCLSLWLSKREIALADCPITDIALAPGLMQGIAASSRLVGSGDRRLANIAARSIIDSLHILASLVNTSKDKGSVVAMMAEDLRCLAWVLLQRDTVARAEVQAQAADKAAPSVDDSSMLGKTSEDLLCLVLALMTTKMVQDPNTVNMMVEMKLSNTCQIGPDCVHKCRCKDAVHLADHLAHLFNRYKNSGGEENGLIISGYLALLMSKLLSHNQITRDSILKILPGGTKSIKVDKVLEALRELEGVHSLVQRKLDDEGSELSITDEGVLRKAIDDLENLIDIV